METDKKAKEFLISATLAAVSISMTANSDAISQNPPGETPHPSLDLHTVVLEDSLSSFAPSSSLSPNSSVEFPLPSNQLSEEEKRDKMINEKFLKIEEIMKANSQLFEDRIEDFSIYGKIYLRVAEKFNYVPWYLIFIVHKAETGASKGEAGFRKDSYYKGAMQRDPNIWPQAFVDKAARGLEDLAALPQRRSDDWKEIAAGAKILGRNIARYEERGMSKDKAVVNALLLYSARVPALSRFATYNIYKEIFSELDLSATKNTNYLKAA